VLIERCGTIERQCGTSLLGGQSGLHRGALAIASAAIVLEQRVAVVTLTRDQRVRHPHMDAADLLRCDARGKDFSNAIVVGLHAIRRSAAADEPRGAEHHDQRLTIAHHPAGITHDLGSDGTSADGERFEEEPRV
jgi:hypothetical protein